MLARGALRGVPYGGPPRRALPVALVLISRPAASFLTRIRAGSFCGINVIAAIRKPL